MHSLQASSLPTAGKLEDGSVWFLKGAARVLTAIAAVVVCYRMKVEVGSLACSLNQSNTTVDSMQF